MQNDNEKEALGKSHDKRTQENLVFGKIASEQGFQQVKENTHNVTIFRFAVQDE